MKQHRFSDSMWRFNSSRFRSSRQMKVKINKFIEEIRIRFWIFCHPKSVHDVPSGRREILKTCLECTSMSCNLTSLRYSLDLSTSLKGPQSILKTSAKKCLLDILRTSVLTGYQFEFSFLLMYWNTSVMNKTGA